MDADAEALGEIEGIGEVIAAAFVDYMTQPENRDMLKRLVKELEIEIPVIDTGSLSLSGLSFVITGSLNHYASRNELKEEIERLGGKVTGSVTDTLMGRIS